MRTIHKRTSLLLENNYLFSAQQLKVFEYIEHYYSKSLSLEKGTKWRGQWMGPKGIGVQLGSAMCGTVPVHKPPNVLCPSCLISKIKGLYMVLRDPICLKLVDMQHDQKLFQNHVRRRVNSKYCFI